jgi:hypothetical protein
MFKIHLANGEYYASKAGRIQHYRSIDRANAKIQKLGEIAAGAIVVECKVKTAAMKEKPKETVPETKIPKVSKTKKAAPKPEKPTSSKTKKTKA